jgi:hypothetical protein
MLRSYLRDEVCVGDLCKTARTRDGLGKKFDKHRDTKIDVSYEKLKEFAIALSFGRIGKNEQGLDEKPPTTSARKTPTDCVSQ